MMVKLHQFICNILRFNRSKTELICIDIRNWVQPDYHVIKQILLYVMGKKRIIQS